jgi:lipid II:glycine glycyltransferase (peptidoglycan interpeptide bridge formation enzyme)
VIEFREADASELETWDDLTVRPAGGHVLQSRGWAEYRARAGWQPRYLVGTDGSGVLALVKPWPIVGGSSAYVSRGPIPKDGADLLAGRLDGAARWLFAHGVDVVAADAQVRADTGYGAALAARGFHPIEEIQPSRHRLSVPLGPGLDEEMALRNVSKQTRQRIRQAETDAVEVARYDGVVAPASVGLGFVAPGRPVEAALGDFYDLLIATAERRHFEVLSRTRFLDWTTTAFAAGQLLYLEAREPSPGSKDALAGLIVYRHGDRLSTFLSGDRDDARARHPGAFHLLRWRAIQLAIREGRAEMDLDGADLPGTRRIPGPDDAAYGLYQHKRSFGGEWVELVGAHERVARPARYALGRLVAAGMRRLGGRRP